MSLSASLKRDIVVSFPIDEVKKSIELVCEKSRASYSIKEKNDVMNLYTITLVGGLVVVPCAIQLKKISENETSIILDCNKVNKTPNQYNEIVDKFLLLISKSLSGEVINENVVASNKSGCLGLLLFLITSTLFGVLYSCNKEETSTNNSSSCGYYTFSDKTTTTTYKGSNNGCYYINSSGNKTYVDSKYCCN